MTMLDFLRLALCASTGAFGGYALGQVRSIRRENAQLRALVASLMPPIAFCAVVADDANAPDSVRAAARAAIPATVTIEKKGPLADGGLSVH